MTAEILQIIDENQFSSWLTGEHSVDYEILEMAVTQCDEALAGMAEALRAGDGVTWKRLAHRSRGCAITVGFGRLSQILHDAEHGILTPDSMRAALAAFSAGLEDTRGQLAARGYQVPPSVQAAAA